MRQCRCRIKSNNSSRHDDYFYGSTRYRQKQWAASNHPVEMDLTSPDPPGSCILHREPRLPPPCNQDTKIHAEINNNDHHTTAACGHNNNDNTTTKKRRACPLDRTLPGSGSHSHQRPPPPPHVLPFCEYAVARLCLPCSPHDKTGSNLGRAQGGISLRVKHANTVDCCQGTSPFPRGRNWQQ